MQQIGTVAQVSIIERWQWYFGALKDPAKIGSASLPIHPGEYKLGYYRTRGKDGQWEPVGIYPDDDGVVSAWRAGKEVDDIPRLFEWCCRNPISHEAYVKALDGGGFDDEPSPGIGHNIGDDVDPHEALRIEYLGEKDTIESFLKKPVKTQADADKVAIWAKRLTAIKAKAEALHKVEKQPHLDAGRAVDDKWRELKTDPDDMVKKMRLHVKPFFDELKRAEEERQRKAREEAEMLRRQAAEEARRANESDQKSAQERERANANAARLAEQAAAAEAEAEARKVSAGRTGARMGLRKEKVGVVTDYVRVATALINLPHKDFIAEIDRLANAAAKKGFPIDGVEVREQDVVR